MTKKEKLLMLAKLNLFLAVSNLGDLSNEMKKPGKNQDPTYLELSDAFIQAIANCDLIIKKLEKESVPYDIEKAEEYVNTHAPFESIAEMLAVLFDLRREFYPMIALQDIVPFIYFYRYAVSVEFGMAYQLDLEGE